MRRVLPLLLAVTAAACSTHRFVASQHPNGKPEVVIFMKGKGEEAEKVMEKVYYQNGQLEYIGHFENGVEHGEWKYFFEDGTKKSTEMWENGLEHGLFIDYAPDGQIRRKITYDKGRKVNEVDMTKQQAPVNP